MKKLLLLVALCLSCLGLGQAPVPPPELKKLDFMLGNWSGMLKFNMPGMEGESEMKIACTMEGMFQKQVSTMNMQGMDSTEIGYLGYDPAKKTYFAYTFTNFAPTPRIETATVSGTKLVFLSKPWDVGMPGGPTESRGTVTRKSSREFDIVLEFRMDGKWTKVGSGTFKKVVQ